MSFMEKRKNLLVPETKEMLKKNDGASRKGTRVNLKKFSKAKAGTILATK